MSQLDKGMGNSSDKVVKQTDKRLIENSDREEKINVLLRKKLDKQGDIKREGQELVHEIVDELIDTEINNIMEVLSQIGGDWLSGRFKHNDKKGIHYDMTGLSIPDIKSRYYTPELLNRLNNFELFGGQTISDHVVVQLNYAIEKKREEREIIFAGLIEESIRIDKWHMTKLIIQGMANADSSILDHPEARELVQKLEQAGISQDDFGDEVYKAKEKQDIEQSRNKILATR